MFLNESNVLQRVLLHLFGRHVSSRGDDYIFYDYWQLLTSKYFSKVNNKTNEIRKISEICLQTETQVEARD